MNSKTHFCPRCKQDRLKEWFGNPKAPYAICLSCRVEVNGEQKQLPQKAKRQSCAICERQLETGEVCTKCEAGLNCFDNQAKLLGRAASYLSGKLRRPHKKHKLKKKRARNVQLQRLIQAQARDDQERKLRFEHAISK